MSLTETNRDVVLQFVELLYVQREVRRAFETFVSPTLYLQHNPNLPDGREAAIVALAPKFTAPGFSIDPLRVVVDGELAAVHLRVNRSATSLGAAVVDIFRLEDGLIVEHWDVLQPMPESPLSPHPMF